jgi:hypothetical protein
MLWYVPRRLKDWEKCRCVVEPHIVGTFEADAEVRRVMHEGSHGIFKRRAHPRESKLSQGSEDECAP